MEIAVLQWDASRGIYELRPARLHTLDDVEALRGDAATAIGNAEIVLSNRRLEGVETEREFREAVLEKAGGKVEAQFIEQNGVLYPGDFHSLNLATAYFNFERARLYALERGLAPEKLLRTPFYYFPEMIIPGAKPPLQVDNAGWFPQLRSFVLFPFDELQDVPLAMNQGVIAHEYGHALFNTEAHAASWYPSSRARWCPQGFCADQRGARMIGIVEEGLADAWALGVTDDPQFTRHSLPMLGDSRNPARFVAGRHCYSQATWEAELERTALLSPADQDEYWGRRQYELGTVLAGVLWRAGQDADTSYDQVMETLLASYRSSGPTSFGAILDTDPDGSIFGNFATVASAWIMAAQDAATRSALCAASMDRLSLTEAELPAACAGVLPNGECG